jgi:agmatinase
MTEMNLKGLRPWGGLAGNPLNGADIVLAGIPYDGSAVYRKGAALAPVRIRELSAVMPPVTEDGRPLDGLKVHDLGDLDAGAEIESGWSKVSDSLAAVPQSALLTVLGGDHCTAIATLAAQARRHPDLAVLWVDAHPDLCDFSRGGKWTCGCAMRRALEVSSIGPARVVIAGGRDYDPEELEFIRARGMLLVSASELGGDSGSARMVADALEGKNLHVSFDIDALDPAFAPGTRSRPAAACPLGKRWISCVSPRRARSWSASTWSRCRHPSTTGTSRRSPHSR